MSRLLTPAIFAALIASVARAEDSLPVSAARASNRFALDLYARLAQEPGNLAFSPYSVSTALSMTYAGARARTAEELAKVVRFAEQVRQHRASEALRADLRHDKVTLVLANMLWIHAGDLFLPEYLDLVETHYGAGAQALDFRDTEAARRTINAWTEKRTRKRIANLIQPGLLSPSTTLVLTNALYFKAPWCDPFAANATREATFHLSASEEVQVPTMYRHGPLRFAEVPGARLAELPYEGERYAIVLLVPDAVDGLRALEKRLDSRLLQRWLAGMTAGRGKLYLPRFKVSKVLRLATTLQEMGVRDAFTSRADFSGMNGKGGIFISEVAHQAFVSVDEAGTEAAAATAVIMKRGAEAHTDTVIRADRPFLFLIHDRRTGCILFLGRVTDPRG